MPKTFLVVAHFFVFYLSLSLFTSDRTYESVRKYFAMNDESNVCLILEKTVELYRVVGARIYVQYTIHSIQETKRYTYPPSVCRYRIESTDK